MSDSSVAASTAMRVIEPNMLPSTVRGPRASGSLLICGGGMQDDNVAIYERFMQLADKAHRLPDGYVGPARIGVVPTATGAESRASETLELLRSFAGSRDVCMIPLYMEDVTKGDDLTIMLLLDSCSALWFVGGDQSRITAVFRPIGSDGQRHDTMAYKATLRILERDGVIAGTSAGAAMMTDPMLTGGTSTDALKNGATWTNDVHGGQGVGLAPGMGYITGVLVDQHFLERGRLGRLLVAMRAANIERGYGINEDAALEVNLREGSLRSWNPSKGQQRFGVVEARLSRNDLAK